MLHRNRARRQGSASWPGGFTLIELTLVVLVIVAILAIAAPRFVPAIAHSQLEGGARHLAGYGRALMAHCALTKDRVTFRIDLDEGEYWSFRWVLVEEGLFDKENEKEMGLTSPPSARVLAGSREEAALRAQEVAEQFERFVRLSMESRARSLREEDGILSEIGPLFDKEFDLEDEEESLEEIETDILARTRLPEGVRFERVQVGQTEYVNGTAEVEVTALGLMEPVEFVLVSSNDRFTVEWDAITGTTRVARAERDE